MQEYIKPEIFLNKMVSSTAQKYDLNHYIDKQNVDLFKLKSNVISILKKTIKYSETDYPLSTKVEYKKEYNDFINIRFTFFSEKNVKVPAHLLIPKKVDGKVPVVICLQGHNSGMHISYGKPIYEHDKELINKSRDFGVQAIKNGYAALLIEQRGFGERADLFEQHIENPTCHHLSLSLLLCGYTMISKRVLDVKKGIDALTIFKEIDQNKIGCMGNSGGGTTTIYAACIDERIKLIMPSCSFSTFEGSILKYKHCICNYIPGIYELFDIPDLFSMILPRYAVIVAGNEDHIFSLEEGVVPAFNKVKRFYEKYGYEDRCKLVVGDGGHMFYPDDSWPIFNSYMEKI